MAFGDDFLNRFGPYRLQDYSVPLYAGGAVGGVPGGGTIGVPGPTPTPAPTPTPTPRPGNNNGGGSYGGGSGSGPSGRDNEGGAGHGVGGGAAGDDAGHPGYGNNAASSAPAFAGAGSGFDGGLFGGGPAAGGWSQGGWSPIDSHGLIDIGQGGSALLGTAATMVPGWGGVGLSLAQMVARGYQLSQINEIRAQQGLPALTAEQIAGGITGLNGYGSLGGNTTVANPQQMGQWLAGNPGYQMLHLMDGPVAETSNGQPYQEGPGGILGWIAGRLGLINDTPVRSFSIDETNALKPNFSDDDWNNMLTAGGMFGDPTSQANVAKGTVNGGGVKTGGNSGGRQSTVSTGTEAKGLLTGGGQLDSANSGKTSKSQSDVTFKGGKDASYSAPVDSKGSKSGGSSGGSGSSNEAKGNAGGSGDKGAGSGRESGGADPGGASGGADQRGDHFARGGYVRGRRDRVPDNRRIQANEGEFVVRNAGAAAAGPALLGLINTPAGARRVRALLGL